MQKAKPSSSRVAQNIEHIENAIRSECKRYGLSYIQAREIYWRPKATELLASADTKLIAQIDKAIRVRTSYIRNNMLMEILLLAIQTHNPMFYFPHYIAAINIYAPTLSRIPTADPDEIVKIIMGITVEEEDNPSAFELLRKRYESIEKREFTFPHETYGLRDLIANQRFPPMTLQELKKALERMYNKEVATPTTLDELATSFKIGFCVINSAHNVDAEAGLLSFPNRMADLVRGSNNPITKPIHIFKTIEYVGKNEPVYTIHNDDADKFIVLLSYGATYLILGRRAEGGWNITFPNPPRFDKPPSRKYNLLPNVSIHEVLKYHAFLRGDDVKAIDSTAILQKLALLWNNGEPSRKEVENKLLDLIDKKPTALERISYKLLSQKLCDAAKVTLDNEMRLEEPSSEFLYTLTNFLEGLLQSD